MRWKRAQIGSLRIKRRFLFLPKYVNGETRWLEWAAWAERCSAGYYYRNGIHWVAEYWYNE